MRRRGHRCRIGRRRRRLVAPGELVEARVEPLGAPRWPRPVRPRRGSCGELIEVADLRLGSVVRGRSTVASWSSAARVRCSRDGGGEAVLAMVSSTACTAGGVAAGQWASAGCAAMSALSCSSSTTWGQLATIQSRRSSCALTAATRCSWIAAEPMSPAVRRSMSSRWSAGAVLISAWSSARRSCIVVAGIAGWTRCGSCRRSVSQIRSRSVRSISSCQPAAAAGSGGGGPRPGVVVVDLAYGPVCRDPGDGAVPYGGTRSVGGPLAEPVREPLGRVSAQSVSRTLACDVRCALEAVGVARLDTVGSERVRPFS